MILTSFSSGDAVSEKIGELGTTEQNETRIELAASSFLITGLPSIYEWQAVSMRLLIQKSCAETKDGMDVILSLFMLRLLLVCLLSVCLSSLE